MGIFDHFRGKAGNVVPPPAPAIDQSPKSEMASEAFSSSEPILMMTKDDEKYIAPALKAADRAKTALLDLIEDRRSDITVEQALEMFTKATTVNEPILTNLKGDPKTADKAFALSNLLTEKKIELQKLAAKVKEVDRSRQALQRVGTTKAETPDRLQVAEPNQETGPGLEKQVKDILTDLSELFSKPEFRHAGQVLTPSEQNTKSVRHENMTGATGFTAIGAFNQLANLREAYNQPGQRNEDRKIIADAITQTKQMMKDRNVDQDVQKYFDALLQ